MLKHTQFSKSMSPAAMIVAILALLLATAGVGYTAATIGTNDLQNDAVTSPKVKDGTLKNADMVRESKYKYVGGSGPNFSNGGQGDCVWTSAHTLLFGLARVGFRTDRFGTVHLSGLVQGANGAGGDALCDLAESEDGIVFRLPKSARPAKHQVRLIGMDTLIIANNQGIIGSGISIPPGAVYWSGDASFGVLLDGVTFLRKGSPQYRSAPTQTGRISPKAAALLARLSAR